MKNKIVLTFDIDPADWAQEYGLAVAEAPDDIATAFASAVDSGGLVAAVIAGWPMMADHTVTAELEQPAPRDTPWVRRVLELSTAHLPPHITTGNINGFDGVIVRPFEHGTSLWVPDDPTAHAAEYSDDEPYPAELLAIQLFARALGCDWVNIDRDSDVVTGLPTFAGR